MTDPLVPEGHGHTTLTTDDRVGLIPSHIATRGDLFDAEQRNIAQALLRPRPAVSVLLDDKYLRDLHKAMFGRVWRWAGRYRLRQTNLGIHSTGIAAAVRTLVGDTSAQVQHSTYEPDEIAVRFHHRLVSIHPFPNGNGRHSRICADLLITALGREPFGWGRDHPPTLVELKQAYRHALQTADAGEINDLLLFARS